MLNTLLFVHLVIALLLIFVVLLQKSSSDGLSGLGGGSNMGLMSAKSAAGFLPKLTIILAILFFSNALVLANISTPKTKDISKKFEATEVDASDEDMNIDLTVDQKSDKGTESRGTEKNDDMEKMTKDTQNKESNTVVRKTSSDK